MKRMLFDTNVILDVMLDRKPHAAGSSAAWASVEAGKMEGLLSAHAVTTIYYLVRKETGAAKAGRIVSAILKVFRIARVDGEVINEALQLPFPDFEDAVTAATARHADCGYIVTRDPRGFRGSPIRAFTPEAILPLLGAE
jgi:predicted nucleic acid-binding protein